MNWEGAANKCADSVPFKRGYLRLTNRDTGEEAGKSGKSVSVQRRSLISSAAYELQLGRITMLGQLNIERYLNDLWGLCPYGLDLTRQPSQLNNPVFAAPYDIGAVLENSNKETIMTDKAQPAIQTITFVYGKDVSTLTDDELFGFIARIESDMAKLEAIKRKPQKLIARLGEMEKEITKLVTLIDTRDAVAMLAGLAK